VINIVTLHHITSYVIYTDEITDELLHVVNGSMFLSAGESA